MTGAGAADDSPSKRSTGLWVGASLGVLVTIAVLVATLGSGGTDDPVSAPPLPPDVATTSTTSPMQGLVSELGELPEGDYTQFCSVVDAGADPAEGKISPERFGEAISTIDFDALVVAVPEGLRPQVELLRDSRETVVELMDSIESLDDVSPADLPDGVLKAILTMGVAYTQHCI